MTAGRRDRRHHAVPLARAGRGPPGRPPRGPLLGRHRALRAADRAASRSTARRRSRSRSSRSTSTRCRPASCSPASRPRWSPSSCARWRRTRRSAIQSADAFIAALENARTRADPAGRDGAPVRARKSAARAGGCGRWWPSSLLAIAVGAYFTFAGKKVDVPEPRRARGQRGGRRRAQARAWRSRSSRACRTTSRATR